jgi:hypothetical protein
MLVCVFCFLHILQGSGSIVLATRLDKTHSWINKEANMQAAMQCAKVSNSANII